MTNNERFNTTLNSCQRPRAVYGALSALGSTDECRLINMIRESKDPNKALEVAVDVLVKFLGGTQP